MLDHMKNQLVLLQYDRRQWELDERTREIGRRGLEQARDALRQARSPGQAA